LTDYQLASKFDGAVKSKLESAVNKAISWLDASSSQQASIEEYIEKLKELESIANPITQKVYS
jgi:heat shock protein 1/8